MQVYMDHLTYLHECADAVHRRGERPAPQCERGKGAGLDVIASFPVMEASEKAFRHLSFYNGLRREKANPARIEAAKQAMEAALVELNAKMRDDLKLNTGAGQIPDAEVFRRKRGA